MMTNKPSFEADFDALKFEAVKLGANQGRDGQMWSVRMGIHPNEVPQDFILAPTGSRWVMAIVRLDDDDTPMLSPAQMDGKRAVKIAATLCRNAAFQEWLGVSGEDAAAVALRDILGILSRSDLSTDEDARKAFWELREEFMKGD